MNMVIDQEDSVITTTQEIRASRSLMSFDLSISSVADVSRSISLVFPETENDAHDLTIIASRHTEPTEPLEHVLNELGL